ncbi:MAG: RNA pseudouridine synthase [Phycisphaerales bacterium]|nr:RNA pseudouridine synthase [Phycisphaerales bacterium]
MSDEPVILHRGHRWLVVNKPAGWHSVAGRGDEPDVEGWLRQAVPDCAALHEGGLVHRLDQTTSGCLLAATREAERVSLRAAMSGRGGIVVGKRYLARVGAGVRSSGQFDLYFTRRHRGSRKVTVRGVGEDAERGQCAWRVLSRDASRGDLIEVDLLGPGRRHIIRAGMAFLGHPLVGDAMYGGGVGGARLHSASLTVDGQTVAAPAPEWARD